MALKQTVKEEVIGKLEEYEGRYEHLYLDTKNKVTVGVGHLLASEISMVFVTMYKVANNFPAGLATLEDKKTEYRNIAKQKKNYKAAWYKKFTTLAMKEGDIDSQRDKHMDPFYLELTSIYKKTNGYPEDFDNFPEKVQIALFDMIFNLGKTKLNNTFPSFNAAIKTSDWKKAAVQSNRPDVSVSRNTYVKDLFNAAELAKPKKTETAKSAAKP